MIVPSFLASTVANFLILKLLCFKKSGKNVNSFYSRSWIHKIIKINLDKFTSGSLCLNTVILQSFGRSFEGGRLAGVLMPFFFRAGCGFILYYVMTIIIEGWSSSITDAFVSTLGNCPQCPRFKIISRHKACHDF